MTPIEIAIRLEKIAEAMRQVAPHLARHASLNAKEMKGAASMFDDWAENMRKI